VRVDNIFELLNKFAKEEDQISAAFGFMLKNNSKILSEFLRRMKIDFTPKDLKRIDIETQVPYDSGESRIDLQVTLYARFLAFVESKLYKNETKIFEQLEKYKEVLERKRTEYSNNVRLIYVNKQPIADKIVQELRRKLALEEHEFYFFSWEDLVRLTEQDPKRETVRLFKSYVGDGMYAKKEMSEQKNKDIVEVLVVYTNPLYWKLAETKKIAVQGNGAPDAMYIAFLRTHRGGKMPSAITHITKVEYTETYVPRKETYKDFPEIVEDAKRRGYDLEGTHKQYVLQEIVSLAREIPHLRGEGTKGQVNFKTTMSELLRVNSVGEIKVARG
jgi:hypothetical protein